MLMQTWSVLLYSGGGACGIGRDIDLQIHNKQNDIENIEPAIRISSLSNCIKTSDNISVEWWKNEGWAIKGIQSLKSIWNRI